MLNIDNELLENINSNALFPIDNDTFEITNLIKAYELEVDSSIINTIDIQYETVLNFIIGLYLENQVLPSDLRELVKNSYNYKIFLLENIKNRMKNIIKENSVHLFKEIFIILNLLSNGNKYSLLTDENMFSIEELHLFLNDYEDIVCEQFIKNDKQNFDLSFKYYLALLEVLNEICVINSLDIQRRKNINGILELITNTISNTKNKIQLEENDIKSLNSILGKLLLYFTNMTYISIDTNNKDIVIQKYAFMLNKIYDGFKLLNCEEKYYLSFLDKITTLILTLIYKLKTKLHIENIDFSDSKDLEDIFILYNKSVNISQHINVSDINDFREKLLENYKYLYSNTTNVSLDEYSDPIEFFISLDEISNIDMLIIHNIVLYSDDIEKRKLDSLVKSLLEKNKFDNDYYEFYKLRIIDRIIQKYISLKISTSENSYIEEIIKYIEKNNLVSHLMSMYAKIYLSLSLYFSYEKEENSQTKSKDFYFIYQRLDNNNFLDKEFYTINKQIIYNYASTYFKQFNFRNQIRFSNNEYLRVGKDLINKSVEIKELNLKNASLLYIEGLIKDILDISEPNDIWLNEKIEILISENIFFGSAKVKIELNDEKFNILEIGFDRYKINIQDDYYLVLYYSSYYKIAFEKILNKNKKFIELNVKNIFKSYINSIPSYTDVITKLPNINKLKSDLKKISDKKITFFEIYLDSLVEFSESYNIKASNEFFKAITSEVNEKFDTYRLFGPKIGMILDENKDYQEIVDFLKNLKINFKNEEKDIKLTIAISIGTADKILDKSFYSLSSAKISNDKLYIFE
ncbi:hypothetical protein [Arcobacter sp. LA11]|uniref:hypothetical protein n=1 Tax=Arcobacter sp. LA11 TaxID=1898176 RepID=UPI0009327351|nr:hypothetical protein [Arcobacter sp. LA11]